MEKSGLVEISSTELTRLDRTVEQLRSRIETNFDAINALLREVATSLSNLKTQLPLQKEAIDDLKIKTASLEDRVTEIEKMYATAKGMTIGAKWLWGCIIAIITFIISNIHRIFEIIHTTK